MREIINTSKLTYLKQFSVKCLEKIVDCYPQSDANDGTEQTASLFQVLYSILCPQWSAMKRYRRCSRGYRWFFLNIYLTFVLNQEHGVNNERSQSIQSFRHFKRTHRMWPHQKDRSARGEKKKCFSHIARSWQSSIYIGPCLKVWYCHRPELFDCRLHSEIMDLYIDQVRVWNGVLPPRDFTLQE